jgi:hypothetical protein
MSALDFYLSQLNIELTSAEATMIGVSSEVIAADATAEVSVPLVNAKNIFQYHSDSIDVSNGVANDLTYKVVYDVSNSAQRMDFDVDTAANVVIAPIDAGAADQNLTYDYVRYLAQNLFNTHKGVDLFNNELQLRQHIKTEFTSEFNTNMIALNDEGELDASASSSLNPSKTLLDQIISLEPERLNDISGNAVDANWFKMPLIAGDKLYFKLNVVAAPGQHNLTTVSPIVDRSYLIKVTLT